MTKRTEHTVGPQSTVGALVNALPSSTVLIDSLGRIVAVNPPWRKFGEENHLALPEAAAGANYLDICDQARGDASEGAREVGAGLRSVLGGVVDEFTKEYPCHSPTERRWFRLRAVPLSTEQFGDGAMVMHEDITERWIAEHEARQAGDLFRATFEKAAVGMAHLSPEGRFLRVNDKVCEIIGYSQSEMVGKDFRDLTIGDDSEEIAESIVALIQGTKPYVARERPGRRKDGTTIWVKIVSTLVRDAANAPDYLLLVIEDVTSLRKAEELAKKSEERYRAVFNLRFQFISILSPEGRVLDINDLALQVGGMRREDVVGELFWETAWWKHQRDASEWWLAFLGEAARASSPVEKPGRYTSADGSVIEATLTALAVKLPDGTVNSYIVQCPDTTERDRAERQTRAVADKLTETLESINDAFVTVDREWRFTYLNAHAEQMLGRSRSDLLGKPMWDEFPAVRGTVVGKHYERAAAERVIIRFEEWFPRFKRWLAVSLYPSTNGLTAFFRDVTDEKNAAETVRISEERFRLLSKATNDAIRDLDFANDRLWWNDGFEFLFGFPRSEAGETIASWTSRIHHEDRDQVLKSFRAAVAGDGEAWSDEYRFARQDGTYADVLDRGYIIRGEDGKAVRMIGGMTDVSDYKRAEAALLSSEARLTAIINASPVPQLLIGGDQRVLSMNAAFVQAFGYTHAEIPTLGEWWHRACPDLSYQYMSVSAWDRLFQSVQSGSPLLTALELTVRCKSGDTKTVLASPAILDRSEPAVHLIVMYDITDRKAAEVELSRTNRALQMLSDCNEALVRADDEDSLLQNVCAIAVEVGGYRIARVTFALEDEASSIVLRAHAGETHPFLQRLKSSWSEERPDDFGPIGRTVRSGQITFVRNLALEPALASVVPELTESGLGSGIYLPLRGAERTFGVLALYFSEADSVAPDELRLLGELANDLAFGIANLRLRVERRKADSDLLASLKEKDILLKEVHHRVKNNMQVITSLLNLEAGRIDHPTTKSVLKDMQNRIQAMAVLHETLYRSGNFAHVDLGSYLRQLSSQLRGSLVSGAGAVQFHIDLLAVRLELVQAIPCGLILNELVSNALKHAFPGGRAGQVWIDLKAMPGGALLLRVRDDGVGLPEDFDLRKSKSLGLQLVADLARQLRGTLQIEPGASFAVTFVPEAA